MNVEDKVVEEKNLPVEEENAEETAVASEENVEEETKVEEPVLTYETLNAEVLTELENSRSEISKLQAENQSLLKQLNTIFKGGSNSTSGDSGNSKTIEVDFKAESNNNTQALNYQEPLTIAEIAKLIN